MKKIKALAVISLMTFGLSSCVIYEAHTVTGNPIGTKKGVVKSDKKGINVGTAAAAKKGGITKIGSVDTRITVFFRAKYTTTVTGE